MKEGNVVQQRGLYRSEFELITVESVRSLISKDRKVTIQWQKH